MSRTPPPVEGVSFTGRRRRRTTRRGVVVADRVARALISIGGLGTIVAVGGVCVFLVWVVAPLFLPARVGEPAALGRAGDGGLLHLGVDDHRLLGWSLHADGRLDVFGLADGALRATARPFPGELTAASFDAASGLAVAGLADGSVQLAEIGFATEVLDAGDLPREVTEALAAEGAPAVTHGDGVVERTPAGQFRRQTLTVELGPRIPLAAGPVLRVAHVARSAGPFVVALAADAAGGRRLWAVSGRARRSFLTGERTLEIGEPVELPVPDLGSGTPRHLLVSGAGDDVYLAWEDGAFARLATARLDDAFVAETGRLVPEGARLTALTTVLGGVTLVWGDSAGRVTAGFPVRLADLGVPLADVEMDDARRSSRAGSALVRAKELSGPRDAAVTALAAASRTRLVAAGSADGTVRLYNVTNASELAARDLGGEEPVTALVVAPKEDALVAATPRRVLVAGLDPRYPEASLSALFTPVWYEGYSEPLHVWQSSSGTDDFEMKLGLAPLVFGTLKATVYSMLFGAPLALLAAIFTSEFLHPRARSVIKPGIELMASLPSVVLGFLAALVIAPFIEAVVPATLALGLTLPLVFLLGAYLWQLAPPRLTLRLGHWRFLFLLLGLPVGVALAINVGPWIEGLLFGGDFKAWLSWEPGGDARYAPAAGAWALLLLPAGAVAVVLASVRWVGPWLRARSAGWSRRATAAADLGRFAAGAGVALAVAAVVGVVLAALGLDPRGGLVDTYVQRNALVVGFVMGFAVIPIIYTLSEDALGAVPEHLRSASLGAGATPWQTAVRIVVPTAMSGLFSAMMVGLGRAVGETMIVLMAAGNTPVMEWNVFEGFRTLSANIAVELPEAVRNSVHYRTLFLAALVLFVLTFLVNTVAELVRLRFRKRAYQL